MEIKLIRNGKEVKFDSLEDFDRVTKELLQRLEKEKKKLKQRRHSNPDLLTASKEEE